MITIDEATGEFTFERAGVQERVPLGSAEGFRILSKLWLRAGWDNKYVYSFTWLGRPMIQLPEDMIRLQEVIVAVQPDVIIECGVAHGGSLVFYASLCHALGRGRVIGVDIEIRAHNRAAIEAHRLASYIHLVEGSSVAPDVVDQIRAMVHAGESVMVFLDSLHTKAHVLAELAAYAPLVTLGSYAVAMDGIMGEVVGAPRTQPDWEWNNPREAAIEFARSNPEFVIEAPAFQFNEGTVEDRVTYWPSAYIKRVK